MPLLVHSPLLPHTPPSGHYADLLDCIQTFLLHFLNSRIELLRYCDLFEEDEIEPLYFRIVRLIPEPQSLNLIQGPSFLHASPIRKGIVRNGRKVTHARRTPYTLHHILSAAYTADINVTRTHSLGTYVTYPHTHTFSTLYCTVYAVGIEIFTETVLRQQIVDSAFDYPHPPYNTHTVHTHHYEEQHQLCTAKGGDKLIQAGVERNQWPLLP
jgi:hypothetical protein